MVKIIAVADSLDGWPTSMLEGTKDPNGEDSRMWIQCAGQGYLQLQKLMALGEDLEQMDEEQQQQKKNKGGGGGDDDDGTGDDNSSSSPSGVPAIDLFSLSEKKLADLDYYQVLQLPYKPNLTADDIKKAYRKASLIYHPDKSGRGEEDAVFLKVKAAFETLSTQKQAYDSTEMPFDDSVPDEMTNCSSTQDFFTEFRPVFERNLHFDARLLPDNGNGGSKKGGGSGGGNNNNNRNRRKSKNTGSQSSESQGPPSLGDETTPIDQVHVFYDYWTHFSSWRDFSLQASRELETQEHLENAESRYEKRWYQKEIDRQAKKLKQLEQARITLLVERAMASDPRLIQERKRLIEEKEMKKKQREQEVLDKKRKEEEAKLAEERRIQEEKEQRTQEKHQREKEKKLLRKTKQAFRKIVADALIALLEPEHALEHPVDEICATLDRERLLKFITRMEAIQSDPAQVIQAVKKRASNLDEDDDDADENDPPVCKENDTNNNINNNNSNGTTTDSSMTSAKERTTTTSSAAVPTSVDSKKGSTTATTSTTTSSSSSNTHIKIPFTKEELSTLAKGVKKFPAGGSNRWDQIANYINNVCRPNIPRTKEECIELYNQNKTKAPPSSSNNGGLSLSGVGTGTTTAAATTTTTTPAAVGGMNGSSESDNNNNNTNGDDIWTEEQDRLLQEGLGQYPVTMDKNERWTKIAKGIPGKTKKQCVTRFKVIREAILSNKSTTT